MTKNLALLNECDLEEGSVGSTALLIRFSEVSPR